MMSLSCLFLLYIYIKMVVCLYIFVSINLCTLHLISLSTDISVSIYLFRGLYTSIYQPVILSPFHSL